MLTTLTFVKTTTPRCAHIAGNVSAHTHTLIHTRLQHTNTHPQRGELNNIYLYIKKNKTISEPEHNQNDNMNHNLWTSTQRISDQTTKGTCLCVCLCVCLS